MTDPLLASIVKLSIPLGMATTIVGGSAWLTTTHNATLENTRELRQLQVDFKKLDDSTDKNRERLGRIEEKLDFIVKMMERRRDRKK